MYCINKYIIIFYNLITFIIIKLIYMSYDENMSYKSVSNANYLYNKSNMSYKTNINNSSTNLKKSNFYKNGPLNLKGKLTYLDNYCSDIYNGIKTIEKEVNTVYYNNKNLEASLNNKYNKIHSNLDDKLLDVKLKIEEKFENQNKENNVFKMNIKEANNIQTELSKNIEKIKKNITILEHHIGIKNTENS